MPWRVRKSKNNNETRFHFIELVRRNHSPRLVIKIYIFYALKNCTFLIAREKLLINSKSRHQLCCLIYQYHWPVLLSYIELSNKEIKKSINMARFNDIGTKMLLCLLQAVTLMAHPAQPSVFQLPHTLTKADKVKLSTWFMKYVLFLAVLILRE